MKYVLMQNSEIIKYPYTLTDLRHDNPNTSFAVQIEPEVLEAFGVYEVEEVSAPEVSDLERLAESDPALIDGKWVQQWSVRLATEQELADAAFRAREEAKIERQALVDSIKVTTSTGKIFDGDEISQGRMARTIIGLQAAGLSSIKWVLADNTETEATLSELTEALILAGKEQSSIWLI